MVAINIPRSRDDWPLGVRRDPAPAEEGPPVSPPSPYDEIARRPRALPDRATRVRRRRLAALVAVVVLVLAVAAAVQVARWLVDVGGSPAPEPLGPGGARPVAGEVYVVQPGDTLWSIATEVAPESDPRAVVAELREANGGPELEVGQRLAIAIE